MGKLKEETLNRTWNKIFDFCNKKISEDVLACFIEDTNYDGDLIREFLEMSNVYNTPLEENFQFDLIDSYMKNEISEIEMKDIVESGYVDANLISKLSESDYMAMKAAGLGAFNKDSKGITDHLSGAWHKIKSAAKSAFENKPGSHTWNDSAAMKAAGLNAEHNKSQAASQIKNAFKDHSSWNPHEDIAKRIALGGGSSSSTPSQKELDLKVYKDFGKGSNHQPDHSPSLKATDHPDLHHPKFDLSKSLAGDAKKGEELVKNLDDHKSLIDKLKDASGPLGKGTNHSIEDNTNIILKGKKHMVDINKFKDQAKDTIGSIKDKVGSVKAEEPSVISQAADKAKKTADEIKDVADKAVEQGKDTVQKVEDHVGQAIEKGKDATKAVVNSIHSGSKETFLATVKRHAHEIASHIKQAAVDHPHIAGALGGAAATAAAIKAAHMFKKHNEMKNKFKR